jgi:hypothetical protein
MRDSIDRNNKAEYSGKEVFSFAAAPLYGKRHTVLGRL